MNNGGDKEIMFTLLTGAYSSQTNWPSNGCMHKSLATLKAEGRVFHMASSKVKEAIIIDTGEDNTPSIQIEDKEQEITSNIVEGFPEIINCGDFRSVLISLLYMKKVDKNSVDYRLPNP